MLSRETKPKTLQLHKEIFLNFFPTLSVGVYVYIYIYKKLREIRKYIDPTCEILEDNKGELHSLPYQVSANYPLILKGSNINYDMILQCSDTSSLDHTNKRWCSSLHRKHDSLSSIFQQNICIILKT